MQAMPMQMQMQQQQQQQQQPPASQHTVQTTQQTVQTTAEVLDAAAEYWKRRNTALWLTVALLCLSLVVLAVGLASATRTDNVPVAGYYPGITVSFGAFLGIVGIHLLENRRPMLTAAIIFISIGVMASFFCAIVDGIIAAEFIPEGYKISVNFLETLDTRPLLQDGCDYYTSGSGYAFDNYYSEVTCRSLDHTCKLKVRSNTCYCCYLYSCENPNYQYYEFTGVSGCWDVIHLHRLLWASVVLNVVGVFLGIITAAILGAYKDLKPITQSQMCPSPAPPPHILYNPNQHMVSYAGYCPSGQALPAYPNYQIPIQHHNYQPSSAPQPGPEGGLTSTTCLSDESQTQPPSHAPTQPPSQGGSQEQGGYMLTPNAPALYGPVYGAFEKPPPYPC